jgi:hypothetical protein
MPFNHFVKSNILIGYLFDNSVLMITEKSTLISLQTGRAISNQTKELETQLNVYCITRDRFHAQLLYNDFDLNYLECR